MWKLYKVSVLTVLFSLINIPVYGNEVINVPYNEVKIGEENETWLTVKANVPKNFTQNISLNFYSDTGFNAIVTLTSLNDFESNIKIEHGKYTLDFVNVYGDIRNKYTYKSLKESINILDQSINYYEITIYENTAKVDTLIKKPEEINIKTNNVKTLYISLGGGLYFLIKVLKNIKS